MRMAWRWGSETKMLTPQKGGFFLLCLDQGFLNKWSGAHLFLVLVGRKRRSFVAASIYERCFNRRPRPDKIHPSPSILFLLQSLYLIIEFTASHSYLTCFGNFWDANIRPHRVPPWFNHSSHHEYKPKYSQGGKFCPLNENSEVQVEATDRRRANNIRDISPNVWVRRDLFGLLRNDLCGLRLLHYRAIVFIISFSAAYLCRWVGTLSLSNDTPHFGRKFVFLSSSATLDNTFLI